MIQSQCATCKQQLITDFFVCPTCNTTAIDMDVDPRTDEQIASVVMAPYPCMTCQRSVLLKEVMRCDNCENQGRKGMQLSIFDVILVAMRQGENTASHIVRQNHLTIEEFGAGVDPRFLGGKTLRQHIDELAKDKYDFAEIYKPRTLQEQIANMGLSLGSASAPPYGQYAPAGNAQVEQGAQGTQANPRPTPGPTPFTPPTRPNFG
jgi:DNA-directed RNA polymerase subunit RPC12/RpoP